MKKLFRQYFLFWILIWLSCACAAHRQTADNQHIPPLETGVIQDSDVYQFQLSTQRKIIVQQAIKSIGLPYKWGGTSPTTGFDCSGLILYTHQMAELPIPRTAKAQFDNGKAVRKENLQVADLVFFKNTKGSKGFHVGIYVGNGMFIHAPGNGRNISYEYLNNPYYIESYIGSRTYL